MTALSTTAADAFHFWKRPICNVSSLSLQPLPRPRLSAVELQHVLTFKRRNMLFELMRLRWNTRNRHTHNFFFPPSSFLTETAHFCPWRWLYLIRLHRVLKRELAEKIFLPPLEYRGQSCSVAKCKSTMPLIVVPGVLLYFFRFALRIFRRRSRATKGCADGQSYRCKCFPIHLEKCCGVPAEQEHSETICCVAGASNGLECFVLY